MKKSTLALSIAAAIGGLGLAGNALAMTDFTTGAAQGATATVLERNDNGIGHQLVFPYFTAQNDNVTLLTVTNTDTTNGKLVKVRFRGAANSDDLYDFQLALSPGDVWTAAISKDAASGKAQLATSDKSCTIPFSVNSTFGTARLDQSSADIANGTREGYVEVFAMADIPKVFATSAAQGYTTALFTTIKHASGVAPCASAVLTDHLYADMSYATATDVTGVGTGKGQLANPTTGLTGDYIILNQKSVAAWSGAATAMEARVSAGGAAGAGKLVFWPQQTDAALDLTTGSLAITTLTADPLLTSGIVTAQNVDLPDMSTPYVNSGTVLNAANQADATTAQLAVKSIANQYVTTPSIAAATDILFAQPTRRYHVAVNYASTSTTVGVVTTKYPLNTTGTTAAAVYRGTTKGTGLTLGTTPSTDAAIQTGTSYYNTTNTAIPTGKRDLCLNSITTPAKNTIFDREETTPATATGGFIISPAPVNSATTLYVCGEAAVISINNGGTVGASALSATVARTDMTSAALSAYNEGWVYFATNGTGNTSGLPILGASFIRASNGTTNYGFSYSNKVTR